MRIIMRSQEEKKQKTPASEKKPSPMALSVVRCVILAVVLGILITVISGLMPIRIENPDALDNMRFGFPFPFIIQHYYGVLYDDWFPGYAPPQFKADACVTELSPGGFFLSAGMNSAFLAVIFVSLTLWRKKRKEKFSSEE